MVADDQYESGEKTDVVITSKIVVLKSKLCKF